MIVAPTASPMLGVMRTLEVEPDSWEEVGVCPICGSAEHLEDLAIVETGTARGSILSACLACEHVFRRRRPSTAWLDAYYASDWDAEGQTAPPTVEPRQKILSFCEPYLEPGATVLDMGAGFGRDLLAFRAAGFNPVGLESSHHRAAYVSDTLGIPCITAPFETAELPESVDLIFSNHVMEHIVEPTAVVRRAAEVLSEGGLFYAALPNCLAFEHPLQLAHYAPHQSGFTLHSMQRLLADHGFEIVRARAGREVEVLARLTGGAPAVNGIPSNGAFGDAVEDWVADGFGRRPGEKTLVWWRGRARPGRCYEGIVVPGGRRALRAVHAARAAHEHLPAALRRPLLPLLPPSENVRVLHVRASGDFELPVRVRYEAGAPPIWVK